MIRNIRRRFIRIAILVLAAAMALVTVIINAANWVYVRAELYDTLDALGEGEGQMPRRGVREGRDGRDGKDRRMRNALKESRFFTVAIQPDGTPTLQDATRAGEADEGALTDIARGALASGKARGFYGDYLFRVDSDDTAVFLNCETRLTRARELALISAAACVGCTLLASLLVALFSSRAIRPLVENAVRQKQFITDAGHELKTPLTVISANMDVLQLETGPNEWVQSTRKQVSGMRALVNELIALSRLDEEDARLTRTAFDLSNTVREAAEPFAGMADFVGKAMTLNIEDGLRFTGDPAAIARLTSILCDNAVKYAPEGDEIAVALRRNRHGIELSTENGLEKPLDGETLQRLFDRFYRADASRSRESGGFGIGLSIARAIVEKHGGTIRAAQTDAGRLRFLCRFRGA